MTNTITQVYLIECLTNMHVGIGGTNYDIVDNAVQKDVITGFPTIFSSSLKGALREYCEHNGLNKEYIKYIFGSDKNDKQSDTGNYKFLPADLLSFPVRSKGIPFYNATSNELVEQINKIGNAFRQGNVIDFSETAEENKPKTKKAGQQLEDYISEGGLVAQNEHIGENIAVFHCRDLQHITEGLPVIARNKLDNGESKNLWYEEVVPRATRFVFFVKAEETVEESKNERLKAFEKMITSKNNPVQIGANGSVGYGYCKIKRIK